MVERDPGLLNKHSYFGYTGLMMAMDNKHHSLTRWLLSQPGLDTSLRTEEHDTALHQAMYGAPLDIVITLVRLSSWETVNMEDGDGDTALDCAVQSKNTSAALYLSWLGAECEEENRKYREVTLQTWITASCQEDAQY